MSKKSLTPIVAVALLLILVVLAVIGFNIWYNTYSNNLQAKIELNTDSLDDIDIEGVIDGMLYIKSGKNTSLLDVKIDGISCHISKNITKGIINISVIGCLENITTSTPEVTLITKNKIASEKVYLKNKPEVYHIDSCKNITLPGIYVLTQDVLSSLTCFNIRTSSVYLDCRGHKIIYGLAGIGVGRGIDIEPNMRDITITNCNIGDGGYGQNAIHLYGDNNCKIIDNTLTSHYSEDIILVDNSHYNEFSNNIIAQFKNCWDGFYVIDDASHNIIKSNKVNVTSDSPLCGNTGIHIDGGDYNIIDSNIVHTFNHSDSRAIRLKTGSTYNTIKNNWAYSDLGWAMDIEYTSSTNNLIYNNFFNSSKIPRDNGINNSWSVSLQPGTNIVGGNYIGGNYYALVNGSGYSQNCLDADGNGICDSPYLINLSYDYSPLTT